MKAEQMLGMAWNLVSRRTSMLVEMLLKLLWCHLVVQRVCKLLKVALVCIKEQFKGPVNRH